MLAQPHPSDARLMLVASTHQRMAERIARHLRSHHDIDAAIVQLPETGEWFHVAVPKRAGARAHAIAGDFVAGYDAGFASALNGGR